uniref:photosystem I subunit X n=1 Tax=Glaucosphaera vacuolata TaxID=38265 RepID=UPI001FCE153B|nr:photosystem I subunit X [Glaucosphaera vacuolata]UNJ18619.1 photosystem I subunit X [Glaucosphaera vacuolata]
MDINYLLSLSVQDFSIKAVMIMLISNIIAIMIGRYTIQVRGLGPSLPFMQGNGLGLPELLATASLGHIVGAGIILGLVR